MLKILARDTWRGQCFIGVPMTIKFRIIVFSLLACCFVSAFAQIAPGRTWAELKLAVQERVNAQLLRKSVPTPWPHRLFVHTPDWRTPP